MSQRPVFLRHSMLVDLQFNGFNNPFRMLGEELGGELHLLDLREILHREIFGILPMGFT